MQKEWTEYAPPTLSYFNAVSTLPLSAIPRPSSIEYQQRDRDRATAIRFYGVVQHPPEPAGKKDEQNQETARLSMSISNGDFPFPRVLLGDSRPAIIGDG